METLINKVNLDALPKAIKKAFLPVASKFYYRNNKISINRSALNDLEFYCKIDLLYHFEEDLPFTVKVDEDAYVEFLDIYSDGVLKGQKQASEILSKNFPLGDSNNQRAFQIFSTVYNKHDNFDKFPSKQLEGETVITLSDFYEYGVNVGTFVTCWEIILDNVYKFEPYFIDQQNHVADEATVKFYGSKIEFTELIKSLIENNNLRGKQKEIFEKCCAFFGVQLENRDKTISDLNKRNIGSETLFLDNLKSALISYLKK